MLQAQLKGKLSRQQENMEDILTSNVFGTFKHLPFEIGLRQFLSKAVNNEEEHIEDTVILPYVENVRYEFWPRMSGPDGLYACEPDVLITYQNGEREVRIIVEAKYRSGKSSTDSFEIDETESAGSNSEANHSAIRDQLSREWISLIHSSSPEAIKILLYVTADYAFPKGDINATQRSCEKAKGIGKANVFWVSWRELCRIYDNAVIQKYPVLADLIAVMKKRYRLTAFNGIYRIRCDSTPWRFSKVEVRVFDWTRKRISVNWRFRSDK